MVLSSGKLNIKPMIECK